MHLVTGVLLSLTIIGIPLGIADFKMAGAALVPFGKEVVNISDLEVIPSGNRGAGGALRGKRERPEERRWKLPTVESGRPRMPEVDPFSMMSMR